jgi:hypothetical protein
VKDGLAFLQGWKEGEEKKRRKEERQQRRPGICKAADMYVYM